MASSLKVNRIVPSSGTNIGFGTASGQIRLAQSAKLTFDGDTNTFIERPASDTLAFTTAGSESFRVHSTGEVTIGTATGTGNNLTVQDAGTSTSAGGNICARFQSNGSGRDATIQLSDNVANSATISMLSSALILKQAGTETIHITSGGSVGIATGAPADKLHVHNGVIVKDQNTNQNAANPGLQVKHAGTINGSWRHDGRLEIAGQDANAKVRLNPDGSVWINGTSDTAPDGYASLLQINSANHTGTITLGRHTANSNGPLLLFHKSRSGTNVPSAAILSNGDLLGGFRCFGADGTDRNSSAAQILFEVDGTVAGNRMPGRIVFGTTKDAANETSPTERLRISSNGQLIHSYLTSTTPPSYNNGNHEGLMIRTTRDDNSNFLGTVDFAAGRASDGTNGGTQFRFFTQPRSTGHSAENMRISSMGYVTTPNNVHFLARRNGHLTGHNANDTGTAVIMNYIATGQSGPNVTDYFNTSNGLFTAPVDGMYLFMMGINGNYSPSHGWLLINGSRSNFGTAVLEGAGGSPTSMQMMHKVTAGQTVGFKFWHNGQTSVQVNDDNNHTYFKGVLLG